MNKKQVWILLILAACLLQSVGILYLILSEEEVEAPQPRSEEVVLPAPGEDEDSSEGIAQIEIGPVPDLTMKIAILADSGTASIPALILDKKGELHLFWQEMISEEETAFWHQQMTPLGEILAREPLEFRDPDAKLKKLVLHPNGRICGFWRGLLNAEFGLYMSCFRGQWDPLRRIGRGSDLADIGPDGDVHMVSALGSALSFQNRIISEGDFSVESPLFAVDVNGVLHIIWLHTGVQANLIHRYSLDRGQTWSEQETIANVGGIPFDLQADEQGGLHLLSVGLAGYYLHWTMEEGWDPVVELECCNGTADMALDPEGRVHITWGSYWQGVYYIQQFEKGVWSAPYLVSDRGINSQIAIDNRHRRHFLWESGGTIYYGVLIPKS